MRAHRFTVDGLRFFHEFLDSQTTENPQGWSLAALVDPALTSPLEQDLELELRHFDSRLQLAQYLDESFLACDLRPATDDKCFWAWVAAYYFEHVCPKGRNGAWSPGARQRWIPESGDWRRYYRHLFAGPWGIYKAHREQPARALAVLCQPPGRPGDVVEQLASRHKVVTSPAVLQFATEVFVDRATGKLRRGAGGKGTGSARRLIAVLDQFDLTWDFDVVGAKQLHLLLPTEFTRS